MNLIFKIIRNVFLLITLPIWILPIVITCSIDDGELWKHITGKRNMFWDD